MKRRLSEGQTNRRRKELHFGETRKRLAGAIKTRNIKRRKTNKNTLRCVSKTVTERDIKRYYYYIWQTKLKYQAQRSGVRVLAVSGRATWGTEEVR